MKRQSREPFFKGGKIAIPANVPSKKIIIQNRGSYARPNERTIAGTDDTIHYSGFQDVPIILPPGSPIEVTSLDIAQKDSIPGSYEEGIPFIEAEIEEDELSFLEEAFEDPIELTPTMKRDDQAIIEARNLLRNNYLERERKEKQKKADAQRIEEIKAAFEKEKPSTREPTLRERPLAMVEVKDSPIMTTQKKAESLFWGLLDVSRETAVPPPV